MLSDEEFIACCNKASNLSELYESLGYKDVNSVKSKMRKEIRERISSLKINNPRLKFKDQSKRIPKLCLNCGKETHNKKFCCYECRKTYENNQKIKAWQETGDTGCATTTTLRNCIRDYIFEHQNGKCSICGIENKWNGRKLNFILDHIDGDASNNSPDNLRLICPNCDSQLDTYKSKNKHSARTKRK